MWIWLIVIARGLLQLGRHEAPMRASCDKSQPTTPAI
jgi:hypothetical protein